MIEKIDQMGRCVWVPEQPKRIISLVPSQTELLYDLGIGERLIGLTKFCVHPRGLKKEKVIVGGTKDFKLDSIRSLKPDLIIGNKEENEQGLIEGLAQEFPVWMSDISRLDEALLMINALGELVNAREKANEISTQIKYNFEQIRNEGNGSCVYLIWNQPIMVAGKATFIDDMLSKVGYKNQIEEERYPALKVDELLDLKPDYLILSSEPFPFKQKHIDHFQSLLPQTKVISVDGEMFSWYGSRLLKSPAYFNAL